MAAQIEIIGEAELRKKIKSNGAEGVYLLFGEEDYLKNYSAKMIRESVSVDETFAVFNEITIDGADFTPHALADAMSSLPFGADKKIIWLRGLSFSSMKSADSENFLSVISSVEELDHNVIVITVPPGEIDTGSLPKRPSPLLKKLAQYMTLVYFSEQTPAKLSQWAARHFAHFGISASSSLCSALVERCGRSMYILSSEIEKLAYYTLSKGGDTASMRDLEFVTIPELNCDTFALTNAVIAGDRAGAVGVLEVLKFRRVEPQYIIGEISSTLWAMSKVSAAAETLNDVKAIAAKTGIHEFRVGMFLNALGDLSRSKSGKERLYQAIALCSDADEKLKSGYSARDYAPIEIMLCSI